MGAMAWEALHEGAVMPRRSAFYPSLAGSSWHDQGVACRRWRGSHSAPLCTMLVDSLYYQSGFLWDSVVGKKQKGSGDDGSLSCGPLPGYMLTCQHPSVRTFSSDVPVVPNPLEQLTVQSPWGTTIRPWIRAHTQNGTIWRHL